MKILVLNGSPRKGVSNTMKVTEAFVDGICEESCGSAEVETINIVDCKITPCTGCLSCWGKTAGECVIKDDIPQIKEKILRSDIIVESFPLYFFGMPGILKLFTDRMLSMMCTYKGQRAELGTSFHGLRYPSKDKKFVIVSSCGYALTDYVYDPLLAQYDCICGKGNYTPILCPQGKTLRVPELKNHIDKFLEKFKQAGREMYRFGKIIPETAEKLSKPPFPERTFKALIQKFWSDEKESVKNV